MPQCAYPDNNEVGRMCAQPQKCVGQVRGGTVNYSIFLKCYYKGGIIFGRMWN